MATQELLRLAEASPGGIASLDPVNDLQLKSVDVVEGSMRLRVLQDSLREFNCIHSPTFAEQVCVCARPSSCLLSVDVLNHLSQSSHRNTHFELFILFETVQMYDEMPCFLFAVKHISFSCAAIAYLCC